MRSLLSKSIVVFCGVLIFMLALAPIPSQMASARPLFNITETPVEPTSPVQPSNTPVVPTQAVEPSIPPTEPSVPPTDPSTPPVQPTNPPSGETADVPDPNRDRPNIGIEKTIDQSEGIPGELVGFSLHVNNRGDKRAENVVVTDNLPSYLQLHDFSTSKGTISASGNTVTASIGTVDVGEYVVVRIRAYVAADAPETGRNTASVTNSNGDKDPNDNSSTITFPIRILPTVTVTTTVVMEEVVTATPEVIVDAPVAPTSANPPAPRPPRDLPPTGESDQSNALNGWIAFLSMVGMFGLGFGFYLRQRSGKKQGS
jgi:uncharacterized repeat protein (TIGR01451 family)